MKPRGALLTLLLALVVLTGCGPKPPVRIGFIGGLTGRVADLGESGRNGVQLAIEEWNRNGGVNGRTVELLVRDDGQNPEQAETVARELLAAKVDAIVGPMTSAMVERVQSVTEAANLVLVSPTVTAHQFSGVDDHLFLMMPSTAREAKLAAEYQRNKLQHHKVVALFDTRNKTYAASWLGDFQSSFSVLGGVVSSISFDSSTEPNYAALAKAALAEQPDAVLLIASAVDAGRLAQQIRGRSNVPMLSSMWAGTEKLIEMGGRSVEGMVLFQYFDRLSAAPSFLEFKKRYSDRFAQPPGFAGLAGYEATNAILNAMARQKSGMTLKQALLQLGPYPGAQGEISFNATGENLRNPYSTIVREGRFVIAD